MPKPNILSKDVTNSSGKSKKDFANKGNNSSESAKSVLSMVQSFEENEQDGRKSAIDPSLRSKTLSAKNSTLSKSCEINNLKLLKNSRPKTEAKKKHVIGPTYKSRNGEFHKLFRTVNANEKIVSDYSCALQLDILFHGRMYISELYLAFYAYLFMKEIKILIKWVDITNMKREKTAKFIPNAILLTTNSDKYYFTSLTMRDKTFLLMREMWQNSLNNCKLTNADFWLWRYYNYGDDLGLDGEHVAVNVDMHNNFNNSLNGAINNIDVCNNNGNNNNNNNNNNNSPDNSNNLSNINNKKVTNNKFVAGNQMTNGSSALNVVNADDAFRLRLTSFDRIQFSNRVHKQLKLLQMETPLKIDTELQNKLCDDNFSCNSYNNGYNTNKDGNNSSNKNGNNGTNMLGPHNNSLHVPVITSMSSEDSNDSQRDNTLLVDDIINNNNDDSDSVSIFYTPLKQKSLETQSTQENQPSNRSPSPLMRFKKNNIWNPLKKSRSKSFEPVKILVSNAEPQLQLQQQQQLHPQQEQQQQQQQQPQQQLPPQQQQLQLQQQQNVEPQNINKKKLVKQASKSSSGNYNDAIGNDNIKVTRDGNMSDVDHGRSKVTGDEQGHLHVIKDLPDIVTSEEQKYDSGGESETAIQCCGHTHLPILVMDETLDLPVDSVFQLCFSDSHIFREFVKSIKTIACLCGRHKDLKMLTYDDIHHYPTDVLFKRMFHRTNFWLKILRCKKAKDVVLSPWSTEADMNGARVRNIAYTVCVNHPLGLKHSPTNEKQILYSDSSPGEFYLVDTECINNGLPYSDDFYIVNRFCISKISDSKCRLRITSQVKYRRKLMGLIRSFIEKNATSGIIETFTVMGHLLKQESNQHSLDTNDQPPIVLSNVIRKKQQRRKPFEKLLMFQSSQMSSDEDKFKTTSSSPSSNNKVTPDAADAIGGGVSNHNNKNNNNLNNNKNNNDNGDENDEDDGGDEGVNVDKRNNNNNTHHHRHYRRSHLHMNGHVPTGEQTVATQVKDIFMGRLTLDKSVQIITVFAVLLFVFNVFLFMKLNHLESLTSKYSIQMSANKMKHLRDPGAPMFLEDLKCDQRRKQNNIQHPARQHNTVYEEKDHENYNNKENVEGTKLAQSNVQNKMIKMELTDWQNVVGSMMEVMEHMARSIVDLKHIAGINFVNSTKVADDLGVSDGGGDPAHP